MPISSTPTNDLSIRDIAIIYGAVLSTAALIWNVIRDLNDRPKLKVEAMIGYMVPSVDKKQSIFLTVSNIGKRPVMVKGWYGELKGTNFMVVTTLLPKMLEESHYLTEKLDDLTVFENGLKNLYITDSTDKKWKISSKNIKSLHKEYSKLKGKGEI
jgi:hypothetical protein